VKTLSQNKLSPKEISFASKLTMKSNRERWVESQKNLDAVIELKAFDVKQKIGQLQKEIRAEKVHEKRQVLFGQA